AVLPMEGARPCFEGCQVLCWCRFGACLVRLDEAVQRPIRAQRHVIEERSRRFRRLTPGKPRLLGLCDFDRHVCHPSPITRSGKLNGETPPWIFRAAASYAQAASILS